MGKTNWKYVFLCGLLAGVVLNILNFAVLAIYLQNIFGPELALLGHPIQQRVGLQTFWVVMYLILGIFAVWLYSAIRPRYGAGAKTAVITALAIWILWSWCYCAVSAANGFFSANALLFDGLAHFVILIVATLLA